jgi:hypothetical protein
MINIMATKVDMIFNHIQYVFNSSKWKTIQTNNKVCFNSTTIPYDEYVIENPSTSEITVSIPLNDVSYKKTFLLKYNNTNNDIINAIINYIKMHLEYYENKKY